MTASELRRRLDSPNPPLLIHVLPEEVFAAASPDRITGQAQFEVDRTEFGSIYGSARFFRFLSKHVVNDHIHLHVILHAHRV